MKFVEPLIPGVFLKRYKRFLTDVRLSDGTVIIAHCPNTGSMKNCQKAGWKVLLSHSSNPKRKLAHTFEMIHNGKCWIGINTGLANRIVEEAIREDVIPGLRGYDEIKREQRYGENSRIDLLLSRESDGGKLCYVEIKNVTLVERGVYRFPDAKTERGQKHLRELMAMVRAGHRACMFYLIQRSDGSYFEPAEDVDPEYASLLREAVRVGVEVLAYRARVGVRGISVVEEVEVRLG